MMKLSRMFSGRGSFGGGFAFLFALSLTGCRLFHGSNDPQFTDVPIEPAVGSTTSSPSGNRFGPDDLVRVTFSGVSEPIAPHEERIKDDGTITLLYIGAVKALGKTPGELQKEIREMYVPRYFNSNLNVTITTQERVFFVRGQVRSPGRIVYGGEMTVTKAISAAGDFTDFANRKKVKLTRADGRSFTVNCIKALENPALDLQVYPGDQIVVPQRIL